MDGARPLRSRIDQNEDGKLDRWEYYDDQGTAREGRPVAQQRRQAGRVGVFRTGRHGRARRDLVDQRREEDRPLGVLRLHGGRYGMARRARQDTNGDGQPDKWETYENGALKTAAFDENGDGTPDRRLTYDGGALVSIESEPDASGAYTKRVPVK